MVLLKLGGYNPFRDESTFIQLLDELKRLENDGHIRVIPYCQAHFPGDVIINKIRRVLFRLYFGDKLENKSWHKN